MSADLLWEIAEEMQAADPAVSGGTIMGSACRRVNGEFLAMPEHRTGALVVKLRRDRVRELIENETGAPFAPAGRVFREWVAAATPDEAQWRALLAEGRAFVGG